MPSTRHTGAVLFGSALGRADRTGRTPPICTGVYAVAPDRALPRLIVLARDHNLKVHRMAAMLVNLTVGSDMAYTRTADDELGTPTH